MKRKTLRKRVSKKSRKTKNKKMSKRKTRINKKHYSRKTLRGGIPKKLITTENLTSKNVFRYIVPENETYKYINDHSIIIIVSKLGDYYKRHHGGLSSKLVRFFLHINPDYTTLTGGLKYTFDLYWASDFKDAGLLFNRKLSGSYYSDPNAKGIDSSFKKALEQLDIDKENLLLQNIETALVDNASKVAERLKKRDTQEDRLSAALAENASKVATQPTTEQTTEPIRVIDPDTYKWFVGYSDDS